MTALKGLIMMTDCHYNQNDKIKFLKKVAFLFFN